MKNRLWYGVSLYPWSSPPIFRVITSSFQLSQPSLTPPARDAHPVSYSFLFPADRKWLEPTDTHTGGSRQEVISLQHLQPGNRTAPAGRW
ncbi:hypothetical protein PBY51_010387 [Eleginops maclovinus]|uniref:Uncharacterized protein n=1 Tax=Eleginops maclovinus TaxID=56733 RepID=A0AAN7XAK5_ELEMC|nr:hypothetical protein PBY51_010387 [Eleginops maclovinus]